MNRSILRLAVLATLFCAFILGGSSSFAKNVRRGNPGEFDYYVLALSWSPQFCATGGARKPGAAQQCGERLGFVIHGLWPQYKSGGWPQNCGQENDLDPGLASVAMNGELRFPVGDLPAHEWNKHGTCSGLSQAGYFQSIATVAAGISIPKELQHVRNKLSLSVDELKSLFVSANSSFGKETLRVKIDRRRSVSGLMLCLSRQLQAMSCLSLSDSDGEVVVLPNEGEQP